LATCRADLRVGAGAVLDHDLLAPDFRQLPCDAARQHVGGAAGGKRADDANRLGRIGLRLGRRSPGDERAGAARP